MAAGGRDSGIMSTPLSIFDVDRTLTKQPTYSLFLIHAARCLSPHRLLLLPFALMAMIGFKLGFMTRKRLKEIMHRLLLGPSVPRDRIEPAVKAFVTGLADHGLIRPPWSK